MDMTHFSMKNQNNFHSVLKEKYDVFSVYSAA